MQPSIPDVTLLEELGRGPGSVVYRALHHGRNCSVKLPSDRPESRAQYTQTSFEQDVLALARLRRWGMPRVLQLGATDETAYAILAEAQGEPLSQRLSRPISRADVLRLVRKLASSVAQLHAAGFVHGNLTVQNVLAAGPSFDIALADRGTITRTPFEVHADLKALGLILRECLGCLTDGRTGLVRLEQCVDALVAGECDDCGELLAELETLSLGERARLSNYPLPHEELLDFGASLDGTRSELAQLLRCWQRAAAHGGTMVEVLGAAGSGKSRLLARFAQEIAARDAQVLSVRCRDSDWAPFSALKRMIDGHLIGLSQLAPERRARLEVALRAAAGPMAAPIGLLSPRLSALFKDAEAAMAEGDVQSVFIESLAQFLTKYLESATAAVLVIDDVHWLDASSRMVLTRVAARVTGQGHMIVCGARDDAESVEHLHRFRAGVSGDRVETVPLGPLCRDDAASIIAEYLGLGNDSPPEELVAQLSQLSDGTPLCLLELLRLVLERGYLRPHQSSWQLDTGGVQRMRLPGSSRALIDRRLSELPIGTLSVLRAAAVIRGRIDQKLLEHATSGSPERVRAALAQALDLRLLGRNKLGRYEFVHDSVWEALLRELQHVRRRELHQRAADALYQQPEQGAEYEYELARHHAGGLLSKDPQRAYAATRRAALRAFDACDDALAVSFFRTAKTAARLAGVDPDREFYVKLAESSLRLGAARHALTYFRRALERSRPGFQRASVLGRIAWIHHFESNPAECLNTLETALAEFDRRIPSEEPVSAVGSVVSWLVSPLAARVGVLSPRDAETLCELYIGCMRVFGESGYPGRALAAVLQLAATRRQLAPCRTAVHAELVIAFLASTLGLEPLWRKGVARAQQLARDIGDPVAQTLCHQVLHIIAAWRGDFLEAERQALACVVERGHFMEQGELCSVCFNMYSIETVLGRPELALQWLERAIERVCLRGRAAASFAIVEDAAYVSLIAVGREKQVPLLKRRLRGVQRAELRKTGIFHLVTFQSQAQAFVERGDVGAGLESVIEEFGRLRQDPRRVHLSILPYFVQVAHARIHQCLRAEPVRWPLLLPKVERALSDLEAGARVPAIAAHARVTRAAVHFFRGEHAQAERCLCAAERLAEEQRSAWVSYAVARIRAHMLRATGNDSAARDQARVAALWAEQYGQHSRLRFIREEFPSSAQARPRTAASDGESSRARNLDALLHISQANSRELGPERQARMILDEVIEALGAERALLFMREGSGQVLGLRAARRAGGDDLESEPVYDRALVQQVYATGQTEISNVLLSYSTSQHIERACIVAALVLREQSVGVLYLDRSEAAGDFTAEDSVLLQALANQVPIALELAEALRERERLQGNLRQAHKMEAIGRLAGGIAHDFNNILTAIQLAAGSLGMSASEPQKGDLADIVGSARRGAELTRQLLLFSRGEQILPQRIVLGDLVERLTPLLHRLLPAGVQLQVDVQPPPVHIVADPSQVERVLTNLCQNAKDAMPHGGTIHVRVGTLSAEESGHVSGELRAGVAYAQLSVRDTGSGMSEEVRTRLFEPFFTTKALQGGTGLGLANVYAIVQHCGGHIEVLSEPGAGSTFHIYLPLAGEVEPALTRESLGLARRSEPPPVADSGDKKLVLIVDDDDGSRRVMVRSLARAGYRVLAARNGQEALRQFDEHRNAFALVVTDMQMPGINGCELASALSARDPALKVLFVSGQGQLELQREGLLRRDATFLQKPFAPVVLLTTIESLIGGANAHVAELRA